MLQKLYYSISLFLYSVHHIYTIEMLIFYTR